MKVPLSWLKDYVDIGVTEKELEENSRSKSAKLRVFERI